MKCPKHPNYKVKRKPKTCTVCWEIWEASQEDSITIEVYRNGQKLVAATDADWNDYTVTEITPGQYMVAVDEATR